MCLDNATLPAWPGTRSGLGLRHHGLILVHLVRCLFLLSPFCCGGLFRYKKGLQEAVHLLFQRSKAKILCSFFITTCLETRTYILKEEDKFFISISYRDSAVLQCNGFQRKLRRGTPRHRRRFKRSSSQQRRRLQCGTAERSWELRLLQPKQ